VQIASTGLTASSCRKGSSVSRRPVLANTGTREYPRGLPNLLSLIGAFHGWLNFYFFSVYTKFGEIM